MFMRIGTAACAVLALFPSLEAAGQDAPPAIGWRGNLTGLFPDANVPTEWSIVSTGPAEGMKCAATIPVDPSDKNVVRVKGGLLTEWLAIGPFTVKDGTADFAKPLVPNEANLAPKAGDKLGELEWKTPQSADDGVTFAGVNTTGARGKVNQGSLATTCLWVRTAGRLRAVVEHPVPMKLFVNGKEVYSNAKEGVAVGNTYALNENRLANVWRVAPSFEFDVKQGWNRLVVKLMSTGMAGWNDLLFMMRLGDAPPVTYERKNVLWETPLPDHGHGTPIVVGDRVFVTSEPDELICIDKLSGAILWSTTNNYYDATPQAERDANPAFHEKVEPLAKQLQEEKDPVKRWAARKKLYDALLEIDKKKYAMKLDEHLHSHFEIVGFTNTPTSDGRHVYFWSGAGVAACYDLDGRRRWIRRLEAKKLFYSAAPAATAGKMAVYFTRMYGLDARTGQTVWEQPGVQRSVGSLLSARIAGVDVFISQKGQVIRASDGRVLWQHPQEILWDTWAPPTVLGDVMYDCWGTMSMWIVDFAGCAGDVWKPKLDCVQGIGGGSAILARTHLGIPRPHTAASPLIHDGKAYLLDWCGGYYVVDLKTKKTLALEELLTDGDVGINAMPVAASCTLVGKHIVAMDNQGHSVVLEPGGACRKVARNRIAMQIQRNWATTTQEYTAYAPPVADSGRMYIRGERHLYCIGSK
jgi:outer membrane protein assembly factor BamB